MKNILVKLLSEPVKRAMINIAEYAVQQLATALAQFIIEMRRREATKKLTSGENDVQLHSESIHPQESQEQTRGLRLATNR